MDTYCFQRRFPGWTLLIYVGRLLPFRQNSKLDVFVNVDAHQFLQSTLVALITGQIRLEGLCPLIRYFKKFHRRHLFSSHLFYLVFIHFPLISYALCLILMSLLLVLSILGSMQSMAVFLFFFCNYFMKLLFSVFLPYVKLLKTIPWIKAVIFQRI